MAATFNEIFKKKMKINPFNICISTFKFKKYSSFYLRLLVMALVLGLNDPPPLEEWRPPLPVESEDFLPLLYLT